MAQQHIHEGKGQELAAYLAQYPDRLFRVIDLVEGEEPTPISAANEATPVIDAKNAAAMAYLKRKLEQDATDDPEEIRKAEEELAEFMCNINANRAATGDHPVYP